MATLAELLFAITCVAVLSLVVGCALGLIGFCVAWGIKAGFR